MTQTGHLPSSGTLGREVALVVPTMPCREAVGMVFLWPCPRARQCLQMSVSVGVSADMCAVSTCVPVRGCGNFDVAVFRAASGSCGSREYPYAMRVLCVSASVPMGRVGSGVAVSACPPTSACVNKCLSKRNRCNRIIPGAVLSAVQEGQAKAYGSGASAPCCFRLPLLRSIVFRSCCELCCRGC